MRGRLPQFTRPTDGHPDSCSTLRECARLLGMSHRTLESWRASGRIEPSPDGTWDPALILEEAEASVENRSDSPEALKWRIEKLRWQAKSERLKHDALADSLISREEVHESRRAQVEVLRESLLPLAGRVAGKIAGTEDRAEIVRLIDAEILAVIRCYSEGPD